MEQTTTIDVDTSFNKTFGDSSFYLNPSSNNIISSFNYISSDSSIVSVNNSGIVQIRKGGIATITIFQNEGYGYTYGSATTTIYVEPATTVINVDTSFNKTFGDNSFPLVATSNNDMSFNYSSSNESVATVNSSGFVTIRSNGSTDITISQSGNDKFTDGSVSTTINVERQTTIINCPPITKTFGDSPFYLTPYITSNSPAPFIYEYYIYTVPGTSDSTPIVGTVDPSSGLVTILNSGIGTIQITQPLYPGFTAITEEEEFIITIEIERQDANIIVDSSFNITFKSEPFNLNASSNSPALITYLSSDHSVARINNEGVVTLQGQLGQAVINMSQNYTDGYTDASASSIINVLPEPTVIDVEPVFNVTEPNRFNLMATSNNNVTSIDFSSNNVNVATVDQWGTVILYNKGTATISLYQPSGYGFTDASATTIINYNDYNTNIIVDSSFNKMYGDASFNLDVSSNSPAPFIYSSSNPSVAAVDTSGNVTLGNNGTAVINVSQDVYQEAGSLYGPGSANTTINVTITTVINVDSSFNKTYGAAMFNLNATSNSPATFLYSSNNNEVATVDTSGNVTLISNGTAEINISQQAVSGYTSTSTTTTIYVARQTTRIEVPSFIEKTYGDASFNLNATSNNPGTIFYSSNNTNVATVSNDGQVTIISDGSATILSFQNPIPGYTGASENTSIIVNPNYNLTYFSINNGESYTSVDVSGELTATIVSENDRQRLTNVIIGTGVTSIGSGAFQQCFNLTNITIPNSVTSIDTNAFYFCVNLSNVIIPNSVTSIGESAFFGCSSLTSIVIPDNVTTIGNSMFYGCSSLTSIDIPDNVTTIGNSVFQSCTNLRSIVIPNNVTTIGNTVFQSCTNLSSVTIGTGITSISDFTFNGCTSLTSIDISNNVTNIGLRAFGSCFTLSSVTIGTGVTTIGSYAFVSCYSLTNITIPNNVTTIGSYAFSDSSNLANVTIGTGITTINQYAFDGCSGLSDMTFNGSTSNIENVADNIFYNISSNGTRRFTFNTANEFEINQLLLNQVKAIVDNDTVSSIGPQIFILPDEITTVITVPSNISKTYGDAPFNLDASSTSLAPFSYVSSTPSVATVDASGIVTLVNSGTATITTSQDTVPGFTDASENTIITVDPSSPENPVIVQDGTEVVYFLTTNSEYATIDNNITITTNLTNTSATFKNLTNGSRNPIFITNSLTPTGQLLYSKNNTTDGGLPVGVEIRKDMMRDNYDDEFDPIDYPDYFRGMAPFTSDNIVAGDKSEDDRLIACKWRDWGNDVFDNWGFFYLYDVEQGKYYFPLISPVNRVYDPNEEDDIETPDGEIYTQTFNAFGRRFTIKHGYPVQGIFKFDISVNDNKPFKFGAYGNMGSDGYEDISYLTYPYSIGSTNLTLYYVKQAETDDDVEIIYSYFIPKNTLENNNKTYHLYQESGNDDNSLMSKDVTNGLIVYFSKTNDVKEWVVNDLDIRN